MPITKTDNDPVWCSNNQKIKVWATSLVSYNRYIDDAKVRFNILCGPDVPINISEIDHVEIIRNEAKYFFEKIVSQNQKELIINGLLYICIDKCISAYDLAANK